MPDEEKLNIDANPLPKDSVLRAPLPEHKIKRNVAEIKRQRTVVFTTIAAFAAILALMLPVALKNRADDSMTDYDPLVAEIIELIEFGEYDKVSDTISAMGGWNDTTLIMYYYSNARADEASGDYAGAYSCLLYRDISLLPDILQDDARRILTDYKDEYTEESMRRIQREMRERSKQREAERLEQQRIKEEQERRQKDWEEWKKNNSDPDPFDASDYSHVDDFYYDHYDDFYDFEDAEDYYYSHTD